MPPSFPPPPPTTPIVVSLISQTCKNSDTVTDSMCGPDSGASRTNGKVLIFDERL